MRHDREGEHTGALAKAFVYRTLSFANRSIFGVVAYLSP
jgi:hypothetical protein